MNVKLLMEMLESCDPNALVVIPGEGNLGNVSKKVKLLNLENPKLLDDGPQQAEGVDLAQLRKTCVAKLGEGEYVLIWNGDEKTTMKN